MFLTLSIITGLLAAWQHFRMDYAGHTEVKDSRRNRVSHRPHCWWSRRSWCSATSAPWPKAPWAATAVHHREGQPGSTQFRTVIHQLRDGR